MKSPSFVGFSASFHASQAMKELPGVDATVSIVQQIEKFLRQWRL